MNIEDLQALWKTQPSDAPVVDEATLLKKVKADSATFDRTIRRRDWRELIAALLLAVWYFFPAQPPIGPRWALIAAVSLILVVPLVAVWARRRVQRREPSRSGDLRHELSGAIAHTRLQVRLLRLVTWWYLLPLWVAGLLHELYRHDELARRWWSSQLVVIVPFFIFVYWLNQRAVRKTLQPQLAQLTALEAQWSNLLAAPSAPNNDSSRQP